MDNKRLKELVNKNETSERILSMVAGRRKNAVFTLFSGLRADLKKRDQKIVDRKEFDSTFDELESLGAGKVSKSDRGVYKGFTWEVPIRKVGAALRSTEDEKAESIAKSASQSEPKKSKLDKVTLVIVRKNGSIKTLKVDESVLPSLAS